MTRHLRVVQLYESLRARAPVLFGLTRRLARGAVALLARVQRFHLLPEQPHDYRVLTGLHEIGTTKVLKSLVHPGMTVVDVGAHIGYFSRLLSRRVGKSGRVIAFEATPETFKVLKMNVGRFGNVTPIHAAVSSRAGTTTLYRSSNSAANSLWPTNTRGAPVSEVQVPSTTLDEAVPEVQVDLVKMDVEGAELDVIKGMEGIISRSPQLRLVVEFYPPSWTNRGLDPYVLLDELRERGFVTSAIHELTGELRLVDGRSDLAALLTTQKYVNLLCQR